MRALLWGFILLASYTWNQTYTFNTMAKRTGQTERQPPEYGSKIKKIFLDRRYVLNLLFSFLVNYLRLSLKGSFSDNFYNSDGKYCSCVPLILQKNNKLKLQ